MTGRQEAVAKLTSMKPCTMMSYDVYAEIARHKLFCCMRAVPKQEAGKSPGGNELSVYHQVKIVGTTAVASCCAIPWQACIGNSILKRTMGQQSCQM